MNPITTIKVSEGPSADRGVSVDASQKSQGGFAEALSGAQSVHDRPMQSSPSENRMQHAEHDTSSGQSTAAPVETTGEAGESSQQEQTVSDDGNTTTSTGESSDTNQSTSDDNTDSDNGVTATIQPTMAVSQGSIAANVETVVVQTVTNTTSTDASDSSQAAPVKSLVAMGGEQKTQSTTPQENPRVLAQAVTTTQVGSVDTQEGDNAANGHGQTNRAPVRTSAQSSGPHVVSDTATGTGNGQALGVGGEIPTPKGQALGVGGEIPTPKGQALGVGGEIPTPKAAANTAHVMNTQGQAPTGVDIPVDPEQTAAANTKGLNQALVASEGKAQAQSSGEAHASMTGIAHAAEASVLTGVKTTVVVDETSVKHQRQAAQAQQSSIPTDGSSGDESVLLKTTDTAAVPNKVHQTPAQASAEAKLQTTQTQSTVVEQGVEPGVVQPKSEGIQPQTNSNAQHRLQMLARGEQASGMLPQERLENIAQQLEARLRISQAAGGTRVSLSLKPRSLGDLHVQLAIKDGSVAATVMAERSDTGKLLQQHSDDLKRILENQGLKVDVMNIHIHDNTAGSMSGTADQSDLNDVMNNSRQSSQTQDENSEMSEAPVLGIDTNDIHDGVVSMLA